MTTEQVARLLAAFNARCCPSPCTPETAMTERVIGAVNLYCGPRVPGQSWGAKPTFDKPWTKRTLLSLEGPEAERLIQRLTPEARPRFEFKDVIDGEGNLSSEGGYMAPEIVDNDE